MDAKLSSSIRAVWANTYTPEGSSFPETVKALMSLGVTRYRIDFVASTATAYVPDAAHNTVLVDTAPIPSHSGSVILGAKWNLDEIVKAIRKAQEGGPEYTYKGFTKTCVENGVTDYSAYLQGKRVVYCGALGDSHTEWFPGSGPPAQK
jgi:uncharacterized protein YbcV (DUF1398 family)